MAGISRAERARRQALLEQGLKECTKCQKALPVAEFNRDKARWDGLDPHCRGCRNSYKAANRETLAEYSREYYAENQERCQRLTREYLRGRRAEDPLFARLRTAASKARRLGNHVESFTSEDLIHSWRGQGIDPAKCIYCDSPFEQIDHVRPITLGGPHIPENLIPSCAACNSEKRDKPLIDFLADRAEAEDTEPHPAVGRYVTTWEPTEADKETAA